MKTRHLISLLITTTLFWVVLSMFFKGYLIALGLVSIALTTWLCTRMRIIDAEGQPLGFLARAPRYWLWLLWQVVLSNLSVCRVILLGQDHIQPQMVEIAPDQDRSSVAHATLANSITLTPGTVTIDANNNGLLVHALTDASAGDLRDGTIAARVDAMEAK